MERLLPEVKNSKKPKPLKPCKIPNPPSSSSSSCAKQIPINDILPPEIITNILSRLHFKLMGQCRCVSKLWYSLLSHPTFPTSDQFSQLSDFPSDLLLHFKSDNGSSRMYYLQDNLSLSKRPLRPLKLLDESSLPGDDGCIVGACSGFICYLSSIKSITSLDVETSIYVFNPLTQERFNLPPLPIRHPHKPYIRKWLSGFGFDESKSQFKFVFIISVDNGQRQRPLKVRYDQVLVHTVGTTSWRSKIGAPEPLIASDETVSSAFVNRSLHWVTFMRPWMLPERLRDTMRLPYNRLLHLVSFNLCSEEFGFVNNPQPYVFKLIHRFYKLGSLEGCLSVHEYCSIRNEEPCINIWSMKKYNVRDSWVKLLSIERQVFPGVSPGIYNPIKFLKNGELLLHSRPQYMICYNPIKKKARHISLGWAGKRPYNVLEIHLLAGSLISVKTAFGVDSETKKTTWSKDKKNFNLAVHREEEIAIE